MLSSRTSLIVAVLAVACGDDTTSSPTSGTTEGETPTTTTTTDPQTSTLPPSTTVEPSMVTTDPSVTATEPSTTTDSAEGSTTMVEPACGDGNEDPGEECDDGNLDQDDNCTAECMIAYEVAWTVSYNGPASNIDSPGNVIIDAAGNALVVGTHRTVTDGFDVWLQQYAPDGTELWNFTYDAGNQLNEGAEAVAMHTSGDVIIAGYAEGALDDDDIMVMRVPFDGDTPTWVDTYDGPGSGPEDFDNGDYTAGVVVDSVGDIGVVGHERTDDERFNAWIRKYDADGGEVWIDTYNGGADRSDDCSEILVTPDDCFIAVCTVEETQNVRSPWIRKYDTLGLEVWTETLPFFPSGAHLDVDGNFIFAGSGDGGTIDIVVAKYDPDFSQVFLEQINGPSAGSDFGRRVTTDADGNIYLAGTIGVNGQQDNMYFAAFDSDGGDLWAHAYNNDEANLGDFGNGVAVGDDGSVYALGSETVLGEQRNVWVRKLTQL